MKLDMAQIVPLRGSPVFYLDKEHLSNNANVTLISQNGEKLKVNHLQLAIFNRLLLNENIEDEPAVITTNLGKFNSNKMCTYIYFIMKIIVLKNKEPINFLHIQKTDYR